MAAGQMSPSKAKMWNQRFEQARAEPNCGNADEQPYQLWVIERQNNRRDEDGQDHDRGQNACFHKG